MTCSLSREQSCTLDAAVESVLRLHDVAAVPGMNDVLLSTVETVLELARARRCGSDDTASVSRALKAST